MTRLVGRYERPLYAFLAKRCGDAQIAEDCFQETFLRAWRSRGRFDRDRPLAPWLYRIAINVAREALGRRRRDRALPLKGDPAPDPALDPAEQASRGDAHARVREGIAALPEDERTVVELRLFGGLSFVEIAEAMRTPVTTARSRMVPMVAWGLFAGAVPVESDLDRLRKDKRIERFERSGNEVRLYLGDIAAGASVRLSMRLRATARGTFTATPSRAWEYYRPDATTTLRPTRFVVR